jgi:hypothetical protein
VVRRALDREVDADLAADLAAAGDHPLELFDRPELRVDRLVPALVGADRPRAARLALRRDQRVVLSLPVRAPDRMDRRQVDDVEPELGELRQHALDALEPAPRAREELVPRAERRPLAVDVDLVRVRPRLLVPVLRRGGERLVDRECLGPEQECALRQLGRQVLLAGIDLASELPLV